MKTFSKFAIYLTFFTLASTTSAEKTEISFVTEEITSGIFMLSGKGGFAGGNIGLLVGEDGVVLIDDAIPPMLEKLNNAISKVTRKRGVDFLINTHVHLDHIGNNAAMKKLGANIIAHENLRKNLLNKPNEKTTEDDLPVITLSSNIKFYLNGEQTHVIHTEKAHTDGDLFVHFEDANVIHTGDLLFNGMFPFIDIDNGGSIQGYIDAQKYILSLCNDKTKIIAGHGPLATLNDIKASINMLESTKGIIQKLIDNGKSEEEIVTLNPLKKFHENWNWGFITTERMTRQLYRGLLMEHKHSESVKTSYSHTHG